MAYKTNALYKGEETEIELVSSPMIGDKIAVDGKLLDPYETVIETTDNVIYVGIPCDCPEDKWGMCCCEKDIYCEE
jgi:hypothetical protein